MSVADIKVDWYADDKRCSVVDEYGQKWWVAPSPSGGYFAICDETGDLHSGMTLEVVLGCLLGERASQFTAGAR